MRILPVLKTSARRASITDRRAAKVILRQMVGALILIACLQWPLAVLAQKKISAIAMDKRSEVSLSKMFKKYSLFTIDAPALADYARTAGGARASVALELPGLDNLNIALEEYELLASDYQRTVASPAGTTVAGRPDVKTYKGSMAGDAASSVYLTLSDKTIFGLVKGNGREYFIEPLRDFDKDAQANSFVVYEPKDVVRLPGQTCGVTEAMEKAAGYTTQSTLQPLGTATGTCKMVELAIATDASMYDKYGSAEATELHIISIVNTMVGIYSNAQLGSNFLQFKIVLQYISQSNANDPYSPAYDGSNINTQLLNFQQWAPTRWNSNSFSLASLWTARRDPASSTVGLAFLGTVCSPSKFQVNKDIVPGSQLGTVMAHETGHNLNAQHDAQSGFIMYPFTSDATTFSSTSLAVMTEYINRTEVSSCLNTCNNTAPVAAFNLPLASTCSRTISLSSLSVGNINQTLWEAPGAIPETSNSSQTTISYTTPGYKIIKLSVADPNGRVSQTAKEIFIGEPPAAACLSRVSGVGTSTVYNFNLESINAPSLIFIGRRYTDFTCANVATLKPASSYTINCNLGFASSNVQNGIQLLLDYNNDGDFADDNEKVFFDGTCRAGNYSFVITTPEQVPVMDKILRLRVISVPCGLAEGDGCSVPDQSNVYDFGVIISDPAKLFYVDYDKDGIGSSSKVFLHSPASPEGFSTETGDCDDNDAQFSVLQTWVVDIDQDGYYTGIPFTACKPMAEGAVVFSNQLPGDCDDNDAQFSVLQTWVVDIDQDGYYTGIPFTACKPMKEGAVVFSNQLPFDCDDRNNAINPGTIWYFDFDNDGYTSGSTLIRCIQPPGRYKLSTQLLGTTIDCNDEDATVYIPQTYYPDADGDGFGSLSGSIQVCQSTPPAGYVAQSGDCLDNNASVNPSAQEVCSNLTDDNCDGVVDEALCFPCLNATQLTTTQITSSSAQLNWYADANPVQWQLQYKTTAKGSKWVNVFLTGNLRTVILQDLSANQNYIWQIRARCGNTWTSYSPAASFRTTRQILPATKLEANGQTKPQSAANLLLYPNPSRGAFTLELQLDKRLSGTANISVRDISGKQLFAQKATVYSGVLRSPVILTNALPGIYMVEAKVQGQSFFSKLTILP